MVRTVEPARLVPHASRHLLMLLLLGVCGWILSAVGWIAWVFATVPDLELAAVAVPFYGWLVGFIPGAVLMLGFGVVQIVRRRYAAGTVAMATGVYLLPLALLAVAVGAVLALQPLFVRQGDLPRGFAALSGPVILLLHVVGLAWGFFRRNQPLPSVARRTIAPPLVGTLGVLIVLALTLLGMPYTGNRGAFELTVDDVQWRAGGGLDVEVTLHVRRDGRYGVHAYYEDRNPSNRTGRGEPVELVEFNGTVYRDQAWTRGRFALQSGESYQFRFHWERLRPLPGYEDRQVVFRIAEPDYTTGEVLREFVIPIPPPE